MKTSWKWVATAAALAVAPAIALAQSADLNTAAPTKNDFRLRVVEPAEGATLTGPSVRVTVNNALPDARGETGSEVSRTAPVPRPDISVTLDGRDQGVLRDAQNVLTLENVSPGSHKLVVVARNRSGEIVDRKEVKFVVSPESAAPGSAAGSSAVSTEASAASPRPQSPPSASEPAPPPPDRPVRSDASTASATSTAGEATLPKTGTSYPAIALGGAALLAAGLWLRRRA